MLVSFFSRQKADIAVAAFTITHERQRVISFTKPYRDLQMSILFGDALGGGLRSMVLPNPTQLRAVGFDPDYGLRGRLCHHPAGQAEPLRPSR